jgi:energy-coupling factor transporter ATP-binding protein EcfA2
MKIQSINSLTMFNDNQIIDLSKKLTIIFGYNGYGKSSISRLINSVSTTKLSNYNTKSLNSLESDKPLYFEILDDNGAKLDVVDAVVFNKDFVDTVIRKSSFIENKITSSSKIVTDLSFSEKEAFDIVSGKLSNIGQSLKIEKESVDRMIQDEITQEKMRINASKMRSYDLAKFYKDYDSMQTNIDQKEFITIRNKILSLGSFDEETRIPNVKLAQFAGIEEFIEIMSYSEEQMKIELFDKIMSNERDWILDGVEFANKDTCPFCYQSIRDVDLVKSFKKYKESNIAKKMESLKRYFSSLHNESNEILSNLQLIENSVLTFKEVIEKSDELISKIIVTRQYVTKIDEEIQKLYNDKRNNEYSIVNVDKSLNSVITGIKSDISAINVIVVNINHTFEKASQTFLKSRQECLDKFIFPSIKRKYLSHIEKIQQMEESYHELKSEHEIADKMYSEALKSRNPVIKEINETFESLGFEKYRVDGNFSLIHNKSRKEIDNSFTEKLSDGEKSLVAFTLFYSQIKLKVFDEPSLIVIDDPVSSLDYENIYNIYYLIDGMVRNNGSEKYLIATHNNIYLSCLLHRRDPKEYNLLRIEKNDSNKSSLIESKTKVSNVYIDKLREVKTISEKQTPSAHDKLIVPNFCRYVLETLSIFQFPNSTDPLSRLENFIREHNKILRNKGEAVFINDTRLTVLFGTINKGSHSTVEKVLDREDESDNTYKRMCCDTVKIVKEFAKFQFENL